ncbi:MAG: siderophore ABC transporter substrate-binding protein [Bacteroidota bacterium]
MKNRTYTFTKGIGLTAFLIVVAIACKQTNSPGKETKTTTTEFLTLTHKLGEVAIAKDSKKVVALDYAALENLDQLGIPVVGMAKSHVPQYLSKYEDSDTIADLGTIFEVDYEKLSELAPDVIFISARMLKNYDELSKIAPTVYLDSEQGKELESLQHNLGVFGAIFNKKEAANTIFNSIKSSVVQLKDTVTGMNKNALIVMHNNGKFSAFGKASRFGIIHNLFGFNEAQEGLDTARHGQAISNEFIQKVNPDYLFIVDRSAVVNKTATNKEAIENVLIQQTNAFKNGKIIYLDPEAWYLSGDGATSFGIMVNEVKENF